MRPLEIDGYIRTGLIVWVNGSTHWNHVFLKDGKLFIMWNRSLFEPLDNVHVDRTDTV